MSLLWIKVYMPVISINVKILIISSILTSIFHYLWIYILKPMTVYNHNKFIPAFSAANQGDEINISKKGEKDMKLYASQGGIFLRNLETRFPGDFSLTGSFGWNSTHFKRNFGLNSHTFERNHELETRLGCFDVTTIMSWGWLKLKWT